MKKGIITTLFAVIVLVWAIPYACQYTETTQRHYKEHTRELYTGNWVPNIFPDDITEIYETHKIDQEQVWLRFNSGKKLINTNNLVQLGIVEKEKLKDQWGSMGSDSIEN